MVGTVEAIQRELVKDGFVMRYIPDEGAADGLPPGEGAFLACSFWLVIDLALIGRHDEAEELFDRLVSLKNDLGLFSEEYDQINQRLIGNTPQAFTHLTLIAGAKVLSDGPTSEGCAMSTMQEALLPTGAQHEIAYGDQHAVVTEVGATLRAYEAGGAPVIDGFGVEELSSAGRGQVLAPWPNRLEDGRYSYGGIDGAAALDEPEHGNAIHGLLRWRSWTLADRADDAVTMRCLLHPQPGYPWLLDIGVRYALGPDGLTVEADATNHSTTAAPFGSGSTRTSRSVPSGSTTRISRCPRGNTWRPTTAGSPPGSTRSTEASWTS